MNGEVRTNTSNMIANKYLPMSKIGSGKFGAVYAGKYVKTDNPVAIKIEFLDTALQTLKHETTILNYLHSKGSVYTPQVYWYGIHLKQYALVMPLYETSIEDLLHQHSTILSKIQSIKMATKMIDILETIHTMGVIHRDIKAQNFMLNGSDIYLIDFGLSTVYVDDNGKNFEPRSASSYMLGTPKFVSIHIHNGQDPSRRDDCISVMYILLYMMRGGHVPWENINIQASGTYEENHILYYKNVERIRIKMDYNESLDPSSSIGIILKHLHELSFSDRPNYQWIISTLMEGC
jgi:serine/threonine protein kinase